MRGLQQDVASLYLDFDPQGDYSLWPPEPWKRELLWVSHKWQNDFFQ